MAIDVLSYIIGKKNGKSVTNVDADNASFIDENHDGNVEMVNMSGKIDLDADGYEFQDTYLDGTIVITEAN